MKSVKKKLSIGAFNDALELLQEIEIGSISLSEKAKIAAIKKHITQQKKDYFSNKKGTAFFPVISKLGNGILKILVTEETKNESNFMEIVEESKERLIRITLKFIKQYFEKSESMLKIFEVQIPSETKIYFEFPKIEENENYEEIEGNSFELAAFFAIISYLLDLVPIKKFVYTGIVNENNFEILSVEGIKTKQETVISEFGEERKLASINNYPEINSLFDEVFGKLSFENNKSKISRYLEMTIDDCISEKKDFNLKMINFMLVGDIKNEEEIQTSYRLFELLLKKTLEAHSEKNDFDGIIINGRIITFLIGMLTPLFKNNTSFFVALNNPSIFERCNNSEEKFKNAIVLVTPNGNSKSTIGEIICFKEK